GLGLAALVGGLASSTATTISLAQQGYKNKKIIFPFVFAIVVTSIIMFGRALLEVSIVNRALIYHLVFILGVMVLTSLFVLIVLWFFTRKKKAKAEDLELTSPFRLWPALQFGFLYIIILIVAELGNQYLGQKGVYLASLVSGLAD